MARDDKQCRFCGRHSERVALGLSCFHCGRVPHRPVIHWVVLSVTLFTAGVIIGRYL